MLEKEIKVLLSEDEFKQILGTFEWEKPYKQVNYYYGSDDFSNEDITIRIREHNGYKLQVKIPMNVEKSLHIKEEFEEPIDKVYSIIPKKRLQKLTHHQFDEDKKILGELITVRRVCRDNSNVEIALDENYYLDKKDYELEIEYKNEYPDELICRFEGFNLNFAQTVRGKNGRFIDRLINNNDL